MNETGNPENAGHTVTVTGTGTVSAAPDHFHINIGIEAQRGTVRQAYADASAALNAVQATLLSLNVPRDAIGSTALDVRAETRWKDGSAPEVTGYTVSSTLTVQLRYDGAAEDVIAAVVDTGNDSVRLNGLAPALTDPTAAHDAARAVAFSDARRAAELYAGLAGRSLGAAVTITEGVAQFAGPMPGLQRAMAASADSSLRIEPGQSNISAAVTVTWELL
jgi:uncharacterized protein YggE